MKTQRIIENSFHYEGFHLIHSDCICARGNYHWQYYNRRRPLLYLVNELRQNRQTRWVLVFLSHDN